jgi:hypothetical protein
MRDYGFGQSAAAVCRNGKWSFIDSQGNAILPEEYEAVGKIGQELTAVRIGGKWGYMDRTGAMVIPAKFDSAGTMGQTAVIKEGDKYGYINRRGKYLFSPQFDSASDGIVTKQSKYGFVFPGMQKEVTGWYDAVIPFYCGFAYVKQNGKWKYIGMDGEMFWQAPE